MVYNRHNTYKKLDDFNLGAQVNRALYHDKVLKQSGVAIEAAVFNRDLLLVGDVPSLLLRQEIVDRITQLQGYRRVFNQVSVHRRPPANMLEDAWITGQIRSAIVADASIDPNDFKIVTHGKIVYLMGDVTPEQAHRVIAIARACPRVLRVVKLLQYYHLSNHA